MTHGLTGYDTYVLECANTSPEPLPQAFGRLGPRNELSGIGPDSKPFDDQSVQQAFTKALDDMLDKADPDGTAAAGMTFFGQVIDHDVTLDAQSAIGTRIDPRSIRNVRAPALDLDCVYGDENQIVSQLHGAFVTMHNILMTALQKEDHLVPAAFEGIRSQAIAQGFTRPSGLFRRHGAS